MSRSSSCSSKPQSLPKQGVTRQIASNTLAAMHRRYNFPGPPTHARPLAEFRASANRAMDLLRQNIQSSVTREIDDVVRKYLEKYFVPAVANIRMNLGDDAVGEDQVRAVCRAMLDAARSLYATAPRALISPCDYSDSESSCSTDLRLSRTNSSPSFNKRSWETDSDSGGTLKRKRLKSSLDADTAVSGVSGYVSASTHLSSSSRPLARPPIDLVKWNPDRLTENTVFVIGSQAQKLLGLGQSRGRLYTKHADIMRYPADSVDREWISNNCLMSTVGGKPYIMVLEDIEELATSEQYRNIADVRISELTKFRAPPFMISKMKAYFTQRSILGEPLSPVSPTPSTPTSLENAYSDMKPELLKTEFKEEISSEASTSNAPFFYNVEHMLDLKNEISDYVEYKVEPNVFLSNEKYFESAENGFGFEVLTDDNLGSIRRGDSNPETSFEIKHADTKNEQPQSIFIPDTEFFGNFLPYVESETNIRSALQNEIGTNLDDITLASEDFELYSRVTRETSDVGFNSADIPALKRINLLTNEASLQNTITMDTESKPSLSATYQQLPSTTVSFPVGDVTSVDGSYKTVRFVSPQQIKMPLMRPARIGVASTSVLSNQSINITPAHVTRRTQEESFFKVNQYIKPEIKSRLQPSEDTSSSQSRIIPNEAASDSKIYTENNCKSDFLSSGDITKLAFWNAGSVPVSSFSINQQQSALPVLPAPASEDGIDNTSNNNYCTLSKNSFTFLSPVSKGICSGGTSSIATVTNTSAVDAATTNLSATHATLTALLSADISYGNVKR